MKARNRGYSYLELILAVTLVFIFIAVALKMLVKFAVDAEQVAMQEVLQSLDKAVMNLTAEQLLESDIAGLARWQGANPMELLAIKPENYAGEYGNPDTKPATGNWYYDYSNKTLVYGVKHDRYFVGAEGTKGQARYQLKFIFADNNGNRQFDPNHDEAQGLELVPEGKYEWAK